MSGANWTTIESDPGVFTELIERMGCSGCQVEELYSLDSDSLHALRPVYGLVFLFKWQKEEDARPVDPDPEASGVFFAKQIISNACATQAILSVLLNRRELDLGPELTQLREFTAGMEPEMKGLAIGNSETIRSVHNSFHPPQPLIPEDDRPDKDDEAFHFIAYVPCGGALFELDGLKAGPIRLADCTEEDWLDKAAQVVTERIGRFSASEIKFNLMAVIGSRQDKYRRELAAAEERCQSERAALDGAGEQLPADADTLRVQLQEAEGEAERLRMQLAMEEDKMQRWREENLRRRTDFVPAIFNLLTGLAEEQQLEALVKSAAASKDADQAAS